MFSIAIIGLFTAFVFSPVLTDKTASITQASVKVAVGQSAASKVTEKKAIAENSGSTALTSTRWDKDDKNSEDWLK